MDHVTAQAHYRNQICEKLHFFQYEHLPIHLQEVSKPFSVLADRLGAGPLNNETVTALTKLLEAKDCAVRAVLRP